MLCISLYESASHTIQPQNNIFNDPCENSVAPVLILNRKIP